MNARSFAGLLAGIGVAIFFVMFIATSTGGDPLGARLLRGRRHPAATPPPATQCIPDCGVRKTKTELTWTSTLPIQKVVSHMRDECENRTAKPTCPNNCTACGGARATWELQIDTKADCTFGSNETDTPQSWTCTATCVQTVSCTKS